MRVPVNYYQSFDADYSREVPAEGYGGWKKTELDLDLARTAVVSMHAWDCGTPEESPGAWRSVEYIPRSYEICRTVFPELFAAVRETGMHLFHVGGGGDYYKQYPGYQRALELAGATEPYPQIEHDESWERLRDFRRDHVFVGAHNRPPACARSPVDFPVEARPQGEEGIAENAGQLLALCREVGVNHLIYCGFAINWCLLLSPGGMNDMNYRGFLCSAFRQATTAVENRETARSEAAKELGLWTVALGYGFVFDVADFVAALATERERNEA